MEAYEPAGQASQVREEEGEKWLAAQGTGSADGSAQEEPAGHGEQKVEEGEEA